MLKIYRFITLLLIVIGALNWGLWGFFQYDLVADIFGGNSSALSRLIYSLVGLAGLYGISFFFLHGFYEAKCCCFKMCSCKKK